MTRRDFLATLGLGAGILACAPLLDLAPCAPAPSLVCFPPEGWVLRISESPEYCFGFTGFASIDDAAIVRQLSRTSVSLALWNPEEAEEEIA